MVRALILLTAVAYCSGMNCQGETPGKALPSDTPCLTKYFNSKFVVGFNPPTEFQGPTDQSLSSVSLRLQWDLSPNGISKFRLNAHASSMTLEQAGAIWAQLAATIAPVFRNERVTVLSGLDGWLVASKTDSVMWVSVCVVRNGGEHWIHATGAAFEGTYDFDYLLGVSRSLCVQEYQGP